MAVGQAWAGEALGGGGGGGPGFGTASPSRLLPMAGAIVIAALLAAVAALGVMYAGAKHDTGSQQANIRADKAAVVKAQSQVTAATATLQNDKGVGALLGPTVKGITQFNQGLDDIILSSNDNATPDQAATSLDEVIAGLTATRAALQEVNVPASEQSDLQALESAVQRELTAFSSALDALGTNDQTQIDNASASQVAALQGLATAFSNPIGKVGSH